MSQIEHTLRMATLEAKEKELRTIVTDGFSRMDRKFEEHEDQIDTLAIELQNLRTEMNERFDKMEKNIYPKLDRILEALAL